MKRFSEQFKKEADRVRLRAVETRELRERLISYMEYHPLPAEQKSVKPNSILSEPFVALRFSFSAWRGTLVMGTLIALIIVPFAAEKALPGDVLYPVKVRFNEEVRSNLSFTPYQKIEWETKRLERRLTEVRLLANEGKLTHEVEVAAAAAVAGHAAAAQQELASLQETDSEEAGLARIAFATALNVQGDALSTAMVRAGIDSTATDGVTAALSFAKEEAAQDKRTPSFEKMMALIEVKTTQAEELFLALKSADVTVKADIERRFEDIERKRQKAIMLHSSSSVEIAPEISEEITETDEASDTETDETGTDEVNISLDNDSASSSVETNVISDKDNEQAEANLLLRQVLESIEKLILYMSDIGLSNNLTVEDLVPATPTEQEQQDSLAKLSANLASQEKAIATRAGKEPSEKVEYGLKQIAELKKKAQEFSKKEYYEQAKVNLEQALKLADDILRVVESENITVTLTNNGKTNSTSTSTSTPAVIEATASSAIDIVTGL